MKYGLLFFCLVFFSFLIAAEETSLPRTVSLSPGLTELIFHLGKGNALVGCSDVCNYPEAAKKLPRAGAFASPWMEPMAALRAELLVSDTIYPPDSAAMVRNLGIRTVIEPCGTIDEYLAWVRRLGKLLQCEKEADLECLRAEQYLTRFRTEAKQVKKKKSVVWIIWTDPLLLAAPGSLPDTELVLAGAENAVPNGRTPYFKASLEWLLAADPDVIILPGMNNAADAVRNHPVWTALRAVRTGQIIRNPEEDILLRPGPRIFDGIETLRNTLYPKTAAKN